MLLVYILAVPYFAVGFVYALYVLLNGIEKWYFFPLNLTFGPIALAYNYYRFVIKRRFPR